MQRWPLVLSAYGYEIEHKIFEDHANCDAFSRLLHEESIVRSKGGVHSVSVIVDDFPITAEDIGKATLVDPVLSEEKVKSAYKVCIRAKWPIRPELIPVSIA